MRRFSTVSCSAIVLAGAMFAASNSGCTINPLSTSDADGGAKADPSSNDDTPNGRADDTSNPSAIGGDSSGQGGSKVEFTPSNVPVDQIDWSKAGDVAINGSCTVSSDEDEFSCAKGQAAFTLFTQPDASRVGMYVVKSFRVEANAILEVEGKLPIVIVALDKMEILGTVRVNAKKDGSSPGGFISDQYHTKGGGPGGGGAGSKTNAGGGASYCGVGGEGGASKNGTAASGGKVYGNPEISPLVGGSSGGSGGLYAGAGGGAIQLVAGGSFLLSATGVIHAGGGGGRKGNPEASGGGSGGAILVEADTATVLGTLAANGGGGGAGWGQGAYLAGDGNDATPDDAMALGGASTDGTSKGGMGTAADVINGSSGTRAENAYPAGGGGGAGRIRINTTSGSATISGTVSPSAGTPCFTQGKLAK